VQFLRQSKYDTDTSIMKRGDVAENIFIIKEGVIQVEVPKSDGNNIHFDYLNPGGCFAVYAAFDSEFTSIL